MKLHRAFMLTASLFSFHCFSQTAFHKLVWSDEFNYHGLPDTSKWKYETGNSGWGNHELEYYTADRTENARVENGMLVIEARKEDYKGAKYTSSRMLTKNLGEWKYGRIEVKARIPKGKGIWPAIWMMPAKSKYGGWPHSGEIDIMEYVGFMPDSIFGSIHAGGVNRTKGLYLSDLASGFHVYGLEWDEDVIRFFVDGRKYTEFKNDKKGSEHWPFDQDFYLILNVAVGGDWGAKYGVDDAIFPQRMEVDWVRVYQ